MTGDTLTYVIIMVVLIAFSAYFSATETAFSSLNRTRLRTLAEKSKKARLALSLADNYDKLISTILIGNNIVNIATASIGTVLFVKLCGDIGATISTIVVTVVVLIFGEISPKSIAKDCPERFAMFSAPFIRLLIWIFTPLNFVFSMWKKLLAKLFKLENDTRMSQEELLMLVDEIQQDGSIDRNEGELLRNAIEFTDSEAEEILTHRVDLKALSVDSTKQEVADAFQESRFSRLLIFEGNIDKIVGVIHQKDFYTGAGITDADLRSIMTPPIFIPKSEKISALLKKLQKNSSHVAVVLDEYGGTYGIVTMEDILEELVGEIWDEHDEIIESFTQLEDGVYRVDASVDLEDFCEYFDVETDSEMVSLGGWVMEQLGRIPAGGDSFVYGEIRVTVAETENHRVTEVDVRSAEAPHLTGEAEAAEAQ